MIDQILLPATTVIVAALLYHGEILGHVARVRDHGCFWSVTMLAFAWSYKQINGCYFEKYFGCCPADHGLYAAAKAARLSIEG